MCRLTVSSVSCRLFAPRAGQARLNTNATAKPIRTLSRRGTIRVRTSSALEDATQMPTSNSRDEYTMTA